MRGRSSERGQQGRPHSRSKSIGSKKRWCSNCGKQSDLKNNCWYLKKEKKDENIDQLLVEASTIDSKETTTCEDFCLSNNIYLLYVWVCTQVHLSTYLHIDTGLSNTILIILE